MMQAGKLPENMVAAMVVAAVLSASTQAMRLDAGRLTLELNASTTSAKVLWATSTLRTPRFSHIHSCTEHWCARRWTTNACSMPRALAMTQQRPRL
jgi:hypothetical protein